MRPTSCYPPPADPSLFLTRRVGGRRSAIFFPTCCARPTCRLATSWPPAPSAPRAMRASTNGLLGVFGLSRFGMVCHFSSFFHLSSSAPKLFHELPCCYPMPIGLWGQTKHLKRVVNVSRAASTQQSHDKHRLFHISLFSGKALCFSHQPTASSRLIALSPNW